MGLTRSSSGLLVRDEFSSDTSGDYTAQKGTLSVSGGYLYSSSYDIWVIHNSVTGAGCVTVVSTRVGTRSAGPVLSQSSAVGTGANIDGYEIRLGNTTQYCRRKTDGGSTDLANFGTSDAAEVLNRAYYTDTGVAFRAGQAATVGALAFTNSASSTDTTYTNKQYGGVYFGPSSSIPVHYLDIRTSHLITCTGMTTGHYFKVSDGTTTAKAIAIDGTAVVDAGAVLFPLTTVGIYNGDPDDGGVLFEELDTSTYADMGGGDIFSYSSTSIKRIGMRKVAR